MKVAKAVESSFADVTFDDKKIKMNEIALSTIILYLFNSVLRKMNEVKTALAMWIKLENLFLAIFLPDHIYLLEQFLSFIMDSSKEVDANLHMSNRMLLSLVNHKVEFYDEHNVIILLNSLPDMYKNVKNVIKYDQDTLIIDIIVTALKSKSLEFKSNGNKMEGCVSYCRAFYQAY